MNNAIECRVCGKLGLLKHQKAIGKTLKKWCGRLLSSVKLLLTDCLLLWQTSNKGVNVSVCAVKTETWSKLVPPPPQSPSPVEESHSHLLSSQGGDSHSAHRCHCRSRRHCSALQRSSVAGSRSLDWKKRTKVEGEMVRNSTWTRKEMHGRWHKLVHQSRGRSSHYRP